MKEGEWDTGLAAARGLLDAQPFSIEAAGVGVYIASVIDDHDRVFEFAARGWQANSHSVLCANNFAFALIKRGELDAGEKVLARAKALGLRPIDEIAIVATTGLLAMRRGSIVVGRVRDN